jgi:hypothetical protein
MQDTIHKPKATEAFTGHSLGINHPDARSIEPFDTSTGVVFPSLPITAITGVSEFVFTFFNEGGRNNLKPGRAVTQLAFYPPGPPGFICLRSFSGAFVTDGGVDLTERPLGKFEVDVRFSAPGVIACTIRLSDSNGDDPVKVTVRGLLVFFR